MITTTTYSAIAAGPISIRCTHPVDRRVDLERALDHLTVRERFLVELHHVRELKLGEIAEMLGADTEDIRSEIKAARRKMRDFLSGRPASGVLMVDQVRHSAARNSSQRLIGLLQLQLDARIAVHQLPPLEQLVVRLTCYPPRLSRRRVADLLGLPVEQIDEILAGAQQEIQRLVDELQ